MEVTRYVLGFAFTPDLNEVLLIEKARPAWQAGKLNGIGGHIEPNECPIEAMVREFREETGLETWIHQWSWFATMRASDWEVVCFRGVFAHCFLRDVMKTTDEPPRQITMDSVPVRGNLVPNLRWLLPMALEQHRNPRNPALEIKYL